MLKIEELWEREQCVYSTFKARALLLTMTPPSQVTTCCHKLNFINLHLNFAFREKERERDDRVRERVHREGESKYAIGRSHNCCDVHTHKQTDKERCETGGERSNSRMSERESHIERERER